VTRLAPSRRLTLKGLDTMRTANAPRPRQLATWASLACIAVLLTACNSSTSSAASSPAAPAGAATFLAAGQDINGTLLHEPACGGFGCALSGDSTAFLASMKWTTWSGTEAVGTGTYKLDDCNPDCAGGRVYPVRTEVTLSQPVKVCSPSGTRWVWSHASFTFPDGLPKALRGDNAPQNPWTFSTVIAAAQQTCRS
jgi:hypothetical protein